MSRLEVLSHSCIVLVCLVASGLLLEKRFGGTRRATIPVGPSLLPGKTISLPGVSWGQAKKTLVVAMQTQCHFCEESMPLYQKLSEAARKRAPGRADASFSLVFTSPERKEVVDKYLASYGVLPSVVLQADIARMGVLGTPTLLVVDSKGSVQEVFRGRLSESNERRLVTLLDQ